MTQRQNKIIEEYLFDVFSKLDGGRFINESNEVIDAWWNDVFLLEAITQMGQHTYSIADFCKPKVFFGSDEDEDDDDQEVGEQDDQDGCGGQRTEAVVNYLNEFYQHEDYYDYFIGNGMYEQEPGESVLQIQYLYVYTVENNDYFMNCIMYGCGNILK